MREKRERRDLPCNVANVIGSSHKVSIGKIPVTSEMHHCMGTFEMDQASVDLHNYLHEGSCVTGTICFLSVC